MKIKYQQYNKIVDIANQIMNIFRSALSVETILDYINIPNHYINENKLLKIEETKDVIVNLGYSEAIWFMQLEISHNLLNIETDDRRLMYLRDLKSNLSNLLHFMKEIIEYDEWCKYDTKIIEDYEDSLNRKKEYDNFICENSYDSEDGQLIVIIDGIEYSNEDLAEMEILKKASINPLLEILYTVIHLIDEFSFTRTIEEHEAQINPTLKVNLIELKADRHRVILLQKIGVFEFLTKKYLDANQQLLSKEAFQKLIEEIICAKTVDIGSDVSKLVCENLDPKKLKTVETAGATKSVNAFLASLGLST